MTADRTGSRRYVLAVRTTDDNGAPLAAIRTLAAEAGLHPDLVTRLVAFGAVEPVGGTPAEPLYPADAAARLARIMRLRRDLGVNYAGALLAVDLLARIDMLEDMLERLDALPRRTTGRHGPAT